MLFGKRVSTEFKTKVLKIASFLGGITADDLMLCMAWESGGTFLPNVGNKAGSGAVGLIQFMPQTAAALGTTTHALSLMTAEEQLDFVQAYFKHWTGRLRNLGDLYMAILWPAAVGKPDSYVLFDKAKGPVAYAQNHGLDFNHDGQITRGEAYARVAALKEAGEKYAS